MEYVRRQRNAENCGRDNRFGRRVAWFIFAMPGLEKRRFKGKAVGEVVMDRGLNSVFQKPGKKGHHYYYPASQEYGFKHRVRGGGMGRVEGKHFMHVASRVYERAFTAKVVNMVEDLFSELG